MKQIAFILTLGIVGCATKQGAESMNDKAHIQYQFAYDFYHKGELIPSLAAGLRAQEHSPNNPDIKNLIGLIYFRQEKYDLAEQSFQSAIDLDPKLTEAYNNLGTVYYVQKRYEEARRVLEKSLENPLYLYPERIYNNLGLVEEATGNDAKAISYYEQSITFRNDFYLPYKNLGHFLLKKGDTKRAKNLLLEATRLCPDCSEPRYHLGSLLLKENKAKEALKYFQEGAKIDPKGYYGVLCKQHILDR